VPDHKLVLVSFNTSAPAYFLCGLLNSDPVALFVRSYSIQTSISGHVFEFIHLPALDSKNTAHARVANLAEKCHSTDDPAHATAIGYMMRYVFQRKVMTADKLFGAASMYLLIGVFWAFLYALIDNYHPGKFTFGGQPAAPTLYDLVYFSFTVLTSVPSGLA
jgi:hypothetical protein